MFFIFLRVLRSPVRSSSLSVWDSGIRSKGLYLFVSPHYQFLTWRNKTSERSLLIPLLAKQNARGRSLDQSRPQHEQYNVGSGPPSRELSPPVLMHKLPRVGHLLTRRPRPTTTDCRAAPSTQATATATATAPCRHVSGTPRHAAPCRPRSRQRTAAQRCIVPCRPRPRQATATDCRAAMRRVGHSQDNGLPRRAATTTAGDRGFKLDRRQQKSPRPLNDNGSSSHGVSGRNKLPRLGDGNGRH
jgi:hypothetical protein